VSVWHEPAVVRDPGPVLFLDRDGVVIEDRHYLADPADVVLVPGAAAAIRAARAAGYAVVGVSNQSGIGRGRFGEADFARVMVRLDGLLAAEGAAFDAFYYCPHGPQDGCRCRKPRPGLLEEAADRLPWQAQTSWLVGDKASDIRLARDADLGAVLVRTGYGGGEEAEVRRIWAGDEMVHLAADLPAAVALLLARDRDGTP
jgi:D-glycero-D-manno-heptose 1,7-bisphosphate phosphatase